MNKEIDLLILEIDRLVLEKYKESKEVFSLEFIKLSNRHKYQLWVEEVTPQAIKLVEQREQEKKENEEKLKEERKRIEQSWKEVQEKQQREKKEEEEREKQLLVTNTESPDKQLTLQNIRDLNTGFDINIMRRVLEELNVEMLKRIVRKGYPHKFTL